MSSHQFRLKLLLDGLAGLLVCGLLTGLAVWLVVAEIIPILLPYPTVALLLAVLLGTFSLAEIPVMVYAMRRLVFERPENRGVVLGLNMLFVFFAAVYGVPVLLLTGSLFWGLAICAFGLLRFVSSLAFVVPPNSPAPDLHTNQLERQS